MTLTITQLPTPMTILDLPEERQKYTTRQPKIHSPHQIDIPY